jgi:nanoRNase/pAp phosphatase (c-di-AMP/oligoRNAs hydrolase)
MTTRTLIIPYQNPDLDGIACALGMEQLFRQEGRDATAAYIGRLDAQTTWALKSAG